jgi:hypothetical protein
MSLKGTAHGKDIIIPKGVVICYPIASGVVDVDGGVDLGYCQEAELGITETTRQVYSARDASMAMAVDKVVKTEYSLPLQLMSISPDNLALIFRGVKSTLVQVAGHYDDAAALAVAAPATLDRAQKLGKRAVTVKAIPYDGGSAAFNVGAQLSTGASTAEIVWVEGTVAAGTLYVVDLSGNDFVDDAVLIDDDGVAPGAAVQNGAVAVKKDIVLTDTGAAKRYVLDTDYGLDEKSGTVFYLDSGDIVADEVLEAYFDYASLTEVVILSGATGIEEYQVEVLPFAEETENRYEYTFWRCSIKLDTTIKLITVAEEETIINVTLTPLTDGPGASSDYPVFRQILV